MILSERKITVPGKKYIIEIQCVYTRRLTAIEWILLHCIHSFENNQSMNDLSLRYVFENIFQLQNSMILLKPCLDNLNRMNVIRIDAGDLFTYETLRFNNLKMTERGEKMLEEGLMPGAPFNTGMEVIYNPLTGSVSSPNSSVFLNSNNIVSFGTPKDYSDDFPGERIRNALQNGLVGGSRFTASQYRIEEVKEKGGRDWNCTFPITVEIHEDKSLTTNPSIIEEQIKDKVSDLLTPKELLGKVDDLPVIDEKAISKIIGSGNNIKEAFQGIGNNARLIAADTAIFNTLNVSFKGKVVFLYDGKDDISINNKSSLIIQIPDEFSLYDCSIINEKNEQVSVCQQWGVYEGRIIDFPIAVEYKNYDRNKPVIQDWIEEIAIEHINNDVRYIAFLTLPLFVGRLSNVKKALYEKWMASELNNILDDINIIQTVCDHLQTDMFSIDEFAEVVLSKINFENNEEALGCIQRIFESKAIRNKVGTHKLLVSSVIANTKAPNTFQELSRVLMALGIKTHDEALLYDDYVEGLYTESVIADIIWTIMNRKYERLPEFFEYDSFFNDYEECIDQIERHVSELDLFAVCNEVSLKKGINMCPGIATLQSYLAELISKNEFLMSRGYNVFSIVAERDKQKAEAFHINIDNINKLLSECIETDYRNQDMVEGERSYKKIFVFDTCALLNEPDLLLYLKEDEWVRIPTKVIEELGIIKDKRSQKYSSSLADTARRISREFLQFYNVVFNEPIKTRFLMENAPFELLPKGLDPKIPDNQIMCVALKYKDEDTIIVTDDNQFRLISEAQGLNTLSGQEFIEHHKDNYISLEERQRNYNERKKNKNAIKKEEDEEILIKTSQTDNTTDIVCNSECADNNFDFAPIDELPIQKIKGVRTELTQKEISFLQQNKINTIGKFRKLTKAAVMNFKVNSKTLSVRSKIANVVEDLSKFPWEKVKT